MFSKVASIAAMTASASAVTRQTVIDPQIRRIYDNQEICRRAPPNMAFEWDNHGVHLWWEEVQAEYAANDAEFYHLFEHWQADRMAIIDRYYWMWNDLLVREEQLDMRAMEDISRYVARHVYVNGIQLGYVVPHLEVYMVSHYNPHADNIISMFALEELPLLDNNLPDLEFNFDLTIHPEEIQEIMQLRLNQYDETVQMLEAYKQIFINDVNTAWDNYINNTIETVQWEASIHREVINDTINYLWDRSAFPGQSLDDVYPRPSVSFAAKNKKAEKTGFSSNDAGIAGIAGVGFLALLYTFNQKQSSKVETVEEEQFERVNIFKQKTPEEGEKLAQPLL